MTCLQGTITYSFQLLLGICTTDHLDTLSIVTSTIDFITTNLVLKSMVLPGCFAVSDGCLCTESGDEGWMLYHYYRVQNHTPAIWQVTQHQSTLLNRFGLSRHFLVYEE